MIERILPAEAAVAVAYDDPADAWLFPDEEMVVARAVSKRRREFTTVRWCARRALVDLGLPPAPITPGEKGSPCWPAGVVGSMTHCDGYRAAAVARAADLAAIGIDAEPHGPLPGGVLDAIALPGELRDLGELASASPKVHWDRLLFSAKESVYKAWFPVTRRWLDFTEAEIVFDAGGAFTATILAADAPYGEYHGRWIVEGGLAATTIIVPV